MVLLFTLTKRSRCVETRACRAVVVVEAVLANVSVVVAVVAEEEMNGVRRYWCLIDPLHRSVMLLFSR